MYIYIYMFLHICVKMRVTYFDTGVLRWGREFAKCFTRVLYPLRVGLQLSPCFVYFINISQIDYTYKHL